MNIQTRGKNTYSKQTQEAPSANSTRLKTPFIPWNVFETDVLTNPARPHTTHKHWALLDTRYVTLQIILFPAIAQYVVYFLHNITFIFFSIKQNTSYAQYRLVSSSWSKYRVLAKICEYSIVSSIDIE